MRVHSRRLADGDGPFVDTLAQMADEKAEMASDTAALQKQARGPYSAVGATRCAGAGACLVACVCSTLEVELAP